MHRKDLNQSVIWSNDCSCIGGYSMQVILWYLNLFLILDAAGDSFVGVHSHGDIDGEVLQDAIEEIGRTKVRWVNQIVSTFRVVHQPWAVVGSVVQHDIRKTQNLQLQQFYSNSILRCCLMLLRLPITSATSQQKLTNSVTILLNWNKLTYSYHRDNVILLLYIQCHSYLWSFHWYLILLKL